MNTIYTIGYASWTLEQVAELVTAHDAVLVDVRLNPVSRKPGFNKYRLARALGEGRYMTVQAFGNVNHRTGGAVALKDPQEGLDAVLPLLAERNVILLCGCKEAATCHRSDVARLIAEVSGAPVVNL